METALLALSAVLLGRFVWHVSTGLLLNLEGKRREQRIRSSLEGPGAPSRFGGGEPLAERWGRLWQGAFDRLLGRAQGSAYAAFLDRWLQRAFPGKGRTPGYVAALQAGGALLGGAVFGLASLSPVLAMMAFLLGLALPVLWVRDEALRRENRLLLELPVALDRLSLCVEAGLTFDQALAHYLGGARPGPLKDEFAALSGQVRAGAHRREALARLSERLRLTDFTLFSTGVIHAERSGTGLSGVLRRLAATLRDKRSQRAEKAVQELPVKLLLPLLFCIMPVTLLMVFAPVLLRLLGE